MNTFSAELFGDIVQQVITFFKICVEETKVNIYGESDGSGKIFLPGVEITSLIERETLDADDTEFGPSKIQIVKFIFRHVSLDLLKLFPEPGDHVMWNDKIFEIHDVNSYENIYGGQSEKPIGIICSSHYSRLSRASMIIRNY